MSKLLVTLMMVFICSSCGLVQKVAIGTTADMLFDATKEIETEGNWEIFKDGIPGNLKMMEGMVFIQPTNKKLLVGLVKGYTGYAFAVTESLYIPDQLKDRDSHLRIQLLANYSKALDFGLRFLEVNGVSFDDLMKNINVDQGIIKLLDKNFDDTTLDLEGVLYTAQSLGSLIFLQKDKMKMVSLLPIVKGMFDWIALKRPNINYGTCDLFFAAYEAGRPKMLGGDPVKGKALFKALINKYPNNWLAHVAYLRFYVIPLADEEEFKKEMDYLKNMREKYLAHIPWRPKSEPVQPEFQDKGLLLFQTIAIKQYEMIQSVEKDLL
ncbi:MAG: hypothetical protein A2X86_19490 [Bdellovibrionales bacterium GWA2_49_15]|nr:MAG: hypothetical protein A2X86_19490 [Bdellovibrionales bacterium GWA2_49_15]HAZ14416.1 hypothetical protein [Bdellovibrionales bacterium]